ncbi:hypothetical protein [Pedobacter psychroterrae]|uniref:Uncharacterized protein n=1 Tax=Pedobacter psychroterrae TaxID=2530453 RepID=A0A4R0NHJ5_9SPHI|nr:hypothetical protein [Pedobacter psychroterrae]TCC99935.1 hypothetical protein EZ437_16995 [Pedobacter psychroterrae]
MIRAVMILFFSFVNLQFVKSQIVFSSDDVDSVKIELKKPEKVPSLSKILASSFASQFDTNKMKKASQKFHVFVLFGVKIGSNGKVEALYTREKMPTALFSIMRDGANLEEAMKKLDYVFKGNENKILMLPMLFKRLSSDNSDKTEWDYTRDLFNIWPAIPLDNKLQIVFLDTYYAAFSHHVN